MTSNVLAILYNGQHGPRSALAESSPLSSACSSFTRRPLPLPPNDTECPVQREAGREIINRGTPSQCSALRGECSQWAGALSESVCEAKRAVRGPNRTKTPLRGPNRTNTPLRSVIIKNRRQYRLLKMPRYWTHPIGDGRWYRSIAQP